MALRTTYANLADGLQPFSIWDQSLADMGNLGTIPCTAVGTNTIVLTPVAAAFSPSPTYGASNQFSFVAAGTSTNSVTVNVGGLGAKNLYKSDGVTQVGASSLISGYFYEIAYGATLNSGSGGFYLLPSAANSLHLVIYTVAPAGSSASDKAGADFVGNGTSDQVAINAAIAAAGVSNAKVIMLPGAYTLTASVTITNANNFVLDCDGTNITGPGGASDAVVISGAQNGSVFRFGRISNGGTGAAIRVTGTNNTYISYRELIGTGAHTGRGLFVDASSAGSTVNFVYGGWTHGFDKGVAFESSGTNFIDTWNSTINFIFDNNTDIYGRSGSGTKNNANTWTVNVDAYINNATAIDIDHLFDVFNVTWGAQAPIPSTTKLLWLRAGAIRNVFYGTPNLYETFGASYIQDDSGNTSNVLNGATVALGTAAKSHIAKWNANYSGILDDGGIVVSGSRYGFGDTNPQYTVTINNNTTQGIAVPSWAVFSTPLGLVAADGTNTAFTMDVYQGGGSFQGFVIFRSAGGTAASKSALLSSSSIGQLAWTGWDGSAYTAQTAAIVGGPSENWSSSAHGTYLDFYTTPSATTALARAMRLQPSGGISVGTASDPGINSLGASGSIKSSGATAGIGYATGAGGTVTQATSKSTGVTLNTTCGAITMNAANLAASTVVSFVLTNSAIGATDVLILNMSGGTVPAGYLLNARCAAGSATIDVRNITAGGIAEAIVIQFAVVKAVNA
jgi:hypothetical protein